MSEEKRDLITHIKGIGRINSPEIETRARTGMHTIYIKEGNNMKFLDELQSEMDILFGLKEPGGQFKEFKTFCDLYHYYTGDEGTTGVFNPRGLPIELRGKMAVNANSFPNALANTLNRFLSAGYNRINYFENILIGQKSPASHLHKGVFVQLGCWNDLPDIDPETEDYPDMPNITDAGNPFDLLQKGCVIPISRKVVINDDVELLKKFILRLGLVARKTHARYIWNFFNDNATSNDGTPWFSVSHGNLAQVRAQKN